MIDRRLFEVAFQEVLRATMRTSRATQDMEPEAAADLAYRYAVAAGKRLAAGALAHDPNCPTLPPPASSTPPQEMPWTQCGHPNCFVGCIVGSDYCAGHQA